MAEEYDIVIVGGGPAGLAAGLYAARARRKTVLVEKGVTGGQIALAAAVENYPGVPDANGFDLAQQMLQQAVRYGLETASSAVRGLEPREGGHLVRTDDGDYLAKAVILAGGAEYTRLGVPGEDRLTGRGVSYCATCDGAFFRDMEVAVVGGGDAALDEGLFLTRYASRVTVIHRRDALRASAILQQRAFASPKMSFRWNTVVRSIEGEEAVERLRLEDVGRGEASELAVAGVFIFIGQTPNTGYLKGLLNLDKGGHVIVNEWMETNVPGVYAAGDVRNNSARQVVSSAGDGATAAIRADRYLSGLRE